MICIGNVLTEGKVYLSNLRAVKSLSVCASAPLRLLAAVALILCTATTADAALLVTPVSSSFFAESSINSISDTVSPNQGATLNPLNVSTSMSGGQMSLTTTGSAGWSSPSSLTVDLDISRPDAATNGTSLGFTGRGNFEYVFNVSADTTVTVDYDVVGTSTNDGGANPGSNASNVFRWWAMQGYPISIVGNIAATTIGFPSFTSPATFSPLVQQGSVVFNILAGTHTLRIRSTQSATGNQPGDRATVGAFQVTIGPIPEPASLSLIVIAGMAFAAHRRSRKVGIGCAMQ